MVKRFQKGKAYTLCLIESGEFGEVSTWCVNVTYTGKYGSMREFRCGGDVYSCDLETRICVVTHHEIISRETVYGYLEYDEIESFTYPSFTNIVPGWQW